MKRKPKQKPTLDQLATRRLKRLTRRRQKRMPLFVATGVATDFAPLPSISQLKRQIQHYQQDICRRILTNRAYSLQRALHYRSLVAARVSPTTLHRLLTKRTTYPPTPEYTAVFWRRTYQKLDTLP